jgi:hypothetical protein
LPFGLMGCVLNLIDGGNYRVQRRLHAILRASYPVG